MVESQSNNVDAAGASMNIGRDGMLAVARQAASTARSIEKMRGELKALQLENARLKKSTHIWRSTFGGGEKSKSPFDLEDLASFAGFTDEDIRVVVDDDEHDDNNTYENKTAQKVRMMARNVVCRLAAYAGFEESDDHFVLAGAGRVAQLLLVVFKHLNRHAEPAVELFFALIGRAISGDPPHLRSFFS